MASRDLLERKSSAFIAPKVKGMLAELQRLCADVAGSGGCEVKFEQETDMEQDNVEARIPFDAEAPIKRALKEELNRMGFKCPGVTFRDARYTMKRMLSIYLCWSCKAPQSDTLMSRDALEQQSSTFIAPKVKGILAELQRLCANVAGNGGCEVQFEKATDMEQDNAEACIPFDAEAPIKRALAEELNRMGFKYPGVIFRECRYTKNRRICTYLSWQPSMSNALLVFKEAGSNLVHMCPVCLNETFVIALSPCGHLLCSQCATRIFSSSVVKCPVCTTHAYNMHSIYG